MLSVLAIIVGVVILLKITGFVFRILGKLLGAILSIIGWIFLAGLAIAVLQIAAVSLPIFIAGIVAMVAAAAS